MDLQTGDSEELISMPEEGEPQPVPAVEDQAESPPIPESIQPAESPDETRAEGASFGEAVNEAIVESQTEDIPQLEEQPQSEAVSRVDLLTLAIELLPDAPVNYLLRGEALVDGGDYALAVEDFKKALELAEPQAETANWGYINRALADRARQALRRLQS